MDLTSTMKNARRTAQRHGPRAAARSLVLAALRRGVAFERVYIYALEASQARRAAAHGHTRLATVDDLLPLTKDSTWQLDHLDRAGLEQLFARKHRCAVNVVGGALAGYAWLNPSRLVVPKLRAAVSLFPGEVHIYKDFTHPMYRGRRLGSQRYLHWLREDPSLRLLTDFAFDNDATLARVRHLGLDRVGTATMVAVGERERLRLSGELAGRDVTAVPSCITQVQAAELAPS